MTAKIIVCVTSQGAVAAVFQHGVKTPCREFPVGETGQKEFGELLQAHPGAPVYLMVDTVEEDYHAEVMPHVSGHARQELLQRKLKQIYRGTPYYAAWVQGREADKRRDDRYLFAALTNTDLLHPWLDIIHALQAPLAGVYLLPMVSQVLLERLKVTATDLLLVNKHNGGLRQSFFQGGLLKASRLAVTDPDNGHDVTHLTTEVGKTRLYLSSLRLMTRETKLTVMLLDTNDSMAELHKRLQLDPGLDCHRLTRSELVARVGEELESCPYALHMTVLGQQPPAHNLAPPSITPVFRHYLQRHQIYRASAVIVAAATIWSGVNLFQLYWINDAIRQLETQTREQQARYVEVTKTFPQTPASAENLEKAVQFAARIRKDSRTPERVMLALSHALETNPEIALTRLSWKFGVEGRDAGKGEDMALPPAAGGWQESGLVEGEVRPFHGDYRAAMASINRLAEKLRHESEIASVSLLQMPLNLHSATALSGNTMDAANAEAVRAEFKLRLVLKERP